MRWPTVPLKEIAPAQTPNIRFSSDEPVWHLTLDQIESHTGNIVNKKIAPASAAGTSTNVFDDGNVLYSKLRPYLNKVICPTEPGIATTELVPLRPRKDLLERRYLTYYLRSNNFLGFASVAVAGVKMPRIIMAKFWKHQVPLPPLSEQRRIVEILDQANALRKKRAKANAKAASILSSLFYKMFGDPATNPKGWLRVPFSELVDIGTHLVDPNQDEYLDFPHIGGEQIEGGTGRILDYKSVSESNLRSGKFVFTERHILYSKIRPYLNKVAFPRFSGVCSADIYPLLPKDNRISPWYIIALLQSRAFLAYAAIHSERLRMPKLNQDQLGAFATPLPDANLVVDFNRYASEIDSTLQLITAQSQKVERIFAVLLHRAFTGDLTAKWREAHMKELLAEMEAQAKALDCPPTQSKSPEIRSKRHAGHDMYNKAALAAYITDRCHAPDRPMGRVKLAKLFYLVQQKAEIELTETFMKRAAGPLDDEIHKFLSLAQKSKWLVLLRGEGDLKPVKPGTNVSNAIEQAEKILGPAKAKVDEMLDQMKGWGYRALERWATVLDASFELMAAGQPATVEGVKDVIQKHPEWVPKLNRDEFSDANIEATLKGLRGFGFIKNQD